MISALIARAFAEGRGELHDADGIVVPREQVRREYAALKRYLLSHFDDGDVVAVSLDTDYRYFLTLCACFEIGLTYLPLNPIWPAERVARIRELAGFRAIFDGAALTRALAFEGDPARSAFRFDEDSTLYILFTSGSTGEPKGVATSRAAYASFLRCTEEIVRDMPRGLRALMVSHFTFDITLFDAALFFLRETSLYFSRAETNLLHLGVLISEHRIEILNAVLNIMSLVLRDGVAERFDFTSLRYVYVCGSRILDGTYRKLVDKLPRAARLYNFYGPTEVTIFSHVYEITRDRARDFHGDDACIGSPFHGVRCRLIEGELALGGVQVFQRYVGAPERTREAKITSGGEEYYLTGDRVYQDEEGRYFVMGRRDDTIKHRGCRVNLLDIDCYVQRLDGVGDCASIAIASEELDHWIVTFVQPKGPVDEAGLKKALATRVVPAEIPDEIRFVDEFPTTSSGKICKQTLARQYRAIR